MDQFNINENEALVFYDRVQEAMVFIQIYNSYLEDQHLRVERNYGEIE